VTARRCRIAGPAALLTAAILAGGCFDDPVRETLEIEMLPDGTAEVRLEVRFADQFAADSSPGAARLRDARETLLQGWDPWTARFADLEPESESYAWQRDGGELRRLTRTARLADPSAITRLFADTAVGAFYERGEGWASLALYPGRSDRASRAEAERVAAELAVWSADVTEYLAAVEALYRYLEAHPKRAEPCFYALYSDLLPEREVALHGEEEELLGDVSNSISEVGRVLSLGGDEAYTLNELAHRVYDPFPARVVVKVPGEPLEVEGFERWSGGLQVAGLGLWEAFAALEGLWVDPDPGLAWVRHFQRDAERPFPLTAFLAYPRRFQPAPDLAETEAALVARLEPQPAYRVVWAVPHSARAPGTTATATPSAASGSIGSPSP